MQPDVAIEGVLFYRASAVKKSELQSLLELDDDGLRAALQTLAERLQRGATRLLETDTEIQLVTAPEMDQLIESLRRDEMKRDIGKAGAETLAVVLYREPVTKAEIERVRGVNSGYILRMLTTRGLIERQSTNGSYTYRITPDLLAHLAVTNKTELPHYSHIMNQIDQFLHQSDHAEQ